MFYHSEFTKEAKCDYMIFAVNSIIIKNIFKYYIKNCEKNKSKLMKNPLELNILKLIENKFYKQAYAVLLIVIVHNICKGNM